MLGLDRLAEDGPEAVKLEAICKSADLTRGSFYHHFTDHEAFLMSLAHHWLQSQTIAVADQINPHATLADQSTALTDAATQIDYRLELGIRELGRRVPAIAEIVSEADAVRLEVLTDLYQKRFELTAEDAANFAYLEYAAFSGIILLDPNMDLDRQKSLALLYDQMMSRALA